MNEAVFLSALHESPNDEVTWLALADWLEENDQSERAELVRLVRRLRTLGVMERAPERAALEDRVAALLLAGVRPVVAEIVNSIGMRLALLPPGVFRMGSPPDEPDHLANERLHEVELTKPFYFSLFTVTQRQYQTVMGVNPSHFSSSGNNREIVIGLDTSAFPADSMTWAEANDFCKRLTELDEEAGLTTTYRLPTEAEWEYACRGGSASTTPFYLGVSLNSNQANFNGRRPYGTTEHGPTLNRPCPVGSYLPNVFGLYDMHGNVSEWTGDRLSSYGTADRRIDPAAPGKAGPRALRNGSAGDGATTSRSAHRIEYGGDSRNAFLGFRVVASWPIEPSTKRRRKS